MNVLEADARAAEQFARDQRMANFKLLQVDAGKVRTPEEAGRCSNLWETAQGDPLKFDVWLAKPEVVKLFACGALHFKSVGQFTTTIASESQ